MIRQNASRKSQKEIMGNGKKKKTIIALLKASYNSVEEEAESTKLKMMKRLWKYYKKWGFRIRYGFILEFV